MTYHQNVPCNCLECGRWVYRHSRQLCLPCWKLHHMSGTLDQFSLWGNVVAMYEDYLLMRRYNPFSTQKQIAKRLGVTPRSISRYEAHRVGRKPMKSLERNAT